MSATTRAIVFPVADNSDTESFVPTPELLLRKRFVNQQQGKSDVPIISVDQSAIAKREQIYAGLGATRLSSKGGVSTAENWPRVAVVPLRSLGADILHFHGDVDLERLQDDLGPEFAVGSDALLSVEQSVEIAAGAGAPEPFGYRYPMSNVANAHRSKEVGSKRRLRGQNVLVGVLDSGVDADHEEFSRRRGDDSVSHAFVGSDDWSRGVVEGRGFDLGGHGTHVASIIGGRAGVAPACRLCVASSSPYVDNRSRMVMFAIGLDWIFTQFTAQSNFKRRTILNLSIGFPLNDGLNGFGGDKKVFLGLINSIVDLDVLVVSSVGNQADACTTPADVDGVLAVGAVDEADALAHFSGFATTPSPKPDILGFGVNVVGATRRPASGDSLYEKRSGTSQAAAYISGLAALYWQRFPQLGAADIKRALKETTYQPAGIPDRLRIGWGIAAWDGKWTP